MAGKDEDACQRGICNRLMHKIESHVSKVETKGKYHRTQTHVV